MRRSPFVSACDKKGARDDRKATGAILGLIHVATAPLRAEKYTVLGRMGAEIRVNGIPARLVGRTVK